MPARAALCGLLLLAAAAVPAPRAAAAGAEEGPRLAGLGLAEALAELQRQGVELVYSSRLVTPGMRVESEPDGATPRERLDRLLAPHGLEVAADPSGWLVVVRSGAEAPTPGWPLRGVVRSAADGRPVAGAWVAVLEADLGMPSAADGSFAMPGLDPGTYTMQVSRLGFVVGRVEGIELAEGGAFVEVELVPMAPARESIVVRPGSRRGAAAGEPIELPVQVTRKGRPVRGLAAENFRVFAGSRAVEIVGFRVVDLAHPDAAGGGGDLPPSAARRHFLFLFDLTATDPLSLSMARQAAAEFVERDLEPADRVAVATLAEGDGPRFVLPFTSDHRTAAYALSGLGADELAIRPVPPGTPAAGEIDAPPEAPEPSETPAPRAFAAGDEAGSVEPSNLDGEHRRTDRQFERHRALGFSESLAQLAALLRGAPGRKQVILLTEALDRSLVVGVSGDTEVERRRIEEMNRAAVSGEVWEVDDHDRYGSAWAVRRLLTLAEEFRRADCSVHSVDLGLFLPETLGSAGGVTGLALLAEETGGRVYERVDDLGRVLSGLLEATSLTYLLTVRPARAAADGRFRRLRVRLRDVPRGSRASYRPGYYAPAPG